MMHSSLNVIRRALEVADGATRNNIAWLVININNNNNAALGEQFRNFPAGVQVPLRGRLRGSPVRGSGPLLPS